MNKNLRNVNQNVEHSGSDRKEGMKNNADDDDDDDDMKLELREKEGI